jgi:hypothetical protein
VAVVSVGKLAQGSGCDVRSAIGFVQLSGGLAGTLEDDSSQRQPAQAPAAAAAATVLSECA